MSNLNLFYTAAFFLLGSIVGSFLSVVIYRLHSKEEGIIFGRSFCPHCKVQLKSYDMIPLFSYLFLKGRCRACNEKISSNYFWLELGTAILFSLSFLHFNFLQDSSILTLASVLILVSLGIGLAVYDIKYMEVPLVLSVLFIVLGALSSYFIFGLEWQSILVGGIIGKGFFWLQYFISKGEWVGLGDSDLGLGIGLILGWKMLLLSLFLAYISASILGIFLLLSKKATRKTKLPLGPFLLSSFFLILLYGEQILAIYTNLFYF